MKMEYTNEIGSRYGITWRGIRRPFDRELGVAGGELAVVDLKTGEILGLRRGFVLAVPTLAGVDWGSANVCPEYVLTDWIGKQRGRSKDFDFTKWFLVKVLKPRNEFID
jgi:hypothetical protein